MKRLILVLLAATGLAGCAAETAQDGVSAEALPGTGWKFVSLVDSDGAMEALDVADITVAFDDEGGIAGSGGCNRYFGTVEFREGGGIALGPLGSTQMACEQGILSREFRFMQALQSCVVAVGAQGRLELESADGVVRVVLEAAPDIADGGA